MVQSLHLYPVKSCGGLTVPHFFVNSAGPEWDRQWMLVDNNGVFLSQRQYPQMALIKTQVDSEGMTIGFGQQFFRVSHGTQAKKTMMVQVWKDQVEAALEPQLFSDLLSQFLGVKCFLVRFSSTSKRPLSKTAEMKILAPQVRFSDKKPLLLVNTSSILDLESKSSESDLSARFRANIIVNGIAPFVEDQWQRIQIGEVVFSQITPCSRCKMIDIDPLTAEPRGQILKTLAEYRRSENKINFGVHLVPENEGRISVGDQVLVL